MSETFAVIDSGTTSTRVRYWRSGHVIWSGSRAAGARDTAIEGHPGRVRDALRDLLREADAQTQTKPQALICSGMITSDVGLHEVPHVEAPAGPSELAERIVFRTLEDVSDVVFAFIPGVKVHPRDMTIDSLDGGDVMRGEETEVFGLRSLLALTGPATFLHFGSHHKAIDVDAEGRITDLRSSMTGELLSAIREHTILKSSTVALDVVTLDLDAARAGAEATGRYGLGRSGFLVRIGERLAGESRERMTSFLLGALAALDLPLLEGRSEEGPIVLYGHGAFPAVLASLLEDQPRPVVRVDGDTADAAAAAGAVELFGLCLRGGSDRA